MIIFLFLTESVKLLSIQYNFLQSKVWWRNNNYYFNLLVPTRKTVNNSIVASRSAVIRKTTDLFKFLVANIYNLSTITKHKVKIINTFCVNIIWHLSKDKENLFERNRKEMHVYIAFSSYSTLNVHVNTVRFVPLWKIESSSFDH